MTERLVGQGKLLAARIDELLETHPLLKVLTSMPAVGVRTGARILIEVGDGSTFPVCTGADTSADSDRACGHCRSTS
jgi:transposase